MIQGECETNTITIFMTKMAKSNATSFDQNG